VEDRILFDPVLTTLLFTRVAVNPYQLCVSTSKV